MAVKPFPGQFRVTQRFGANPKSYERFGMKGHNGMDFALPNDTELRSPVTGQVVERDYDPGGYGYYIVIKETSTGDEWLLAHMRPVFSVALWAYVEAGQMVGRSDNTGNSTGAHLHLGYRPYGYGRTNGYYGYENPRPHIEGLPPYRVCLQAGHYPNGGGAPGEAQWAQRFCLALIPRLNALGVETVLVGDFWNKQTPLEVTGDYDLFYSVHYDGSVYGPTPDMNRGAFVDYGAGETEVWEAARFNNLWESMYPKATGIPHRERANANTDYYYAFSKLSGPTPGIVAEHGCGGNVAFWEGDKFRPEGGDRAILHDGLGVVVAAVEQVFVRYFSLTVAPPPPPPVEEYRYLKMDENGIIESYCRPLWAAAGHTWIEPAPGLARAWAQRFREKRLWFGRPNGPELTLKDGSGWFQEFQHGGLWWYADGKVESYGGIAVT